MKRLAIVLGAAALVVASCGGGDEESGVSKAEYERRTAAIYTELATSMRLPLATTAQRRDAAPQVAGAMRAAADETEAIEPPEEIAEPHDAYVAALRRCADSFEEILAREGRTDEVFAALSDLDCVGEMQEALTEVEQAGYRIEDPIGGVG